MHMLDRLTGRLSDVNAEIVATGGISCFELGANCTDGAPESRFFCIRQAKEIAFVPTGNHQRMARTEREGIKERYCRFVLDEKLMILNLFTERAGRHHLLPYAIWWPLVSLIGTATHQTKLNRLRRLSKSPCAALPRSRIIMPQAISLELALARYILDRGAPLP